MTDPKGGISPGFQTQSKLSDYHARQAVMLLRLAIKHAQRGDLSAAHLCSGDGADHLVMGMQFAQAHRESGDG